MAEITSEAVDAALATLKAAPDGLLKPHEKEITALQVRAQATDTLAGESKPKAPTPRLPEAVEPPANLFAQPDKLDEALGQGEAAYAERVKKLEKLGVLIAGGKLPLVAPVNIGGQNVDALPITPWGKMADAIRENENLRRALAALDAPSGLPLIQPDLRAGSLQRQIQAGGMQVYPAFDLNGDTTGNLIPFGFDETFLTAILKMDDEARRAAFAAMAKKRMLESGKLHTDGHLGLSFMDAGAEVSNRTLGMNMFTAVADARKLGLHVVAPENSVGAEQIADTKLDQDFWTWLDDFDAEAGFALFARWPRSARVLRLRHVGPRGGDPSRGSRREARASGRGLEI